MNRSNTYFLRMVPVLLLAFSLTACSGNSGSSRDSTGSSPVNGSAPLLVISTAAQGAQAASAGIDAARGAATFGIKLSTIADQAAAAISTLPGIGVIPLTFDCGSRRPVLFGSTSTPNSITTTRNGNVINAFFNTCRSGSAMSDGTMTVDLSGGTVLVFTLGSGAAPLSVTYYESAVSPIVTALFTASAALSYSVSAGTDTLIVTGWTEHWDYIRHVHDRYDLANVFMTVTKNTAVIGTDAYDTETLTIQGGMTRTVFVSDIDPAISYSESVLMTNVTVVDKTPAAGSAAVYQYLSIDGDLSITTVPPGRCVDGAFSVATNTELKIDHASGMVVAGQLTVNSAAVATFNADGSVTVSVAGVVPATFTRPELLTICAL